jgi:3-dehydroquinate dehydratase
MALSFLIVHDPGVDIAPAKRAAESAGAAVTFHVARDPETLMEGMDTAENHDALIVTPPQETAAGDAYQAALADLTAGSFPVVEMTPENRAATQPDAPGPIGSMATIAGFGPKGYALAIELLAERLS